ncbi:MAG: protein kinase domain-containing protein [Thermoguttaceae bacterium]|jgi:WD40 repeat protein
MASQIFNAMCPHCREPYVDFPIELLGKKARCRNCKKIFILTEYHDEDSLLQDVDASKLASSSSKRRDEDLEDLQLVNTASYHPFSDDVKSKIPEETSAILRSDVGLSFDDETNTALTKEFANKFPDPPKGVWKVGESLLNGMCRVLPLKPDELYAEGGVGIVQRVRRRDWNVDLIVKSPKPGVAVTESGKKTFERECQTWIELGLHANIVSCYFVRRIDGIPRLFAEYAPDGTLRDWVADKRIYVGSPREQLARLLDISIQFAWGLEHAHSQGVLHLDVKPGNVMTSGSTIKVTDFGLSKCVSSADEDGDSSSYCEGMTPSYCSPEQYEAFQLYRKRRKQKGSSQENFTTAPITKQSDIWSWAISILSMFHGRSPCRQGGQTAAEVFEVFLKTQDPERRPVIPPRMVELMRWCFKKNPSDRPESMQFVADRLIEIYEESIGTPYTRRQPQNAASTAESFSNKAISLLDLGKAPEALRLLKEASELEPNHPLITFNNALAFWRSGKILDSQAVKRVEELVQNRSFDSMTSFVSGLIQIERGNLKSAISALERALELDPQRRNIRRLIPQLERLQPLDAQCLTQYVLKKPDEKTPPSLYVSEDEDIMLVELVSGEFATISALTGKTFMKFLPSETESATLSQNTLKIAVSEDYRWNLIFRSGGRAVIKLATVGSDKKHDAKVHLKKVDWDALATRSVTLSSKKGARTSVENSLQFKPSQNGIDVIWKGAVKYRIVDPEHTITAFAVSSDGKWLATGNEISEIRIWNVEQERCVRTFLGRGSTVEAIWFDSCKCSVIALSKGNCCQIFNVQLLCNFPRTIQAPHQLCQINSSEELLERQTKFDNLIEKARKAEMSNDVGTVVDAFHEIQEVEGWEATRSVFEDLLERRAVRTKISGIVPTLHLTAHEGVVSTLATSWNASFLASAGKDAAIRLWTRRQGKSSANQWGQILELDSHDDWIRTIALSPDDRFLASAGWDQRIYLWDLATGKKLRTLPEKIKSPTKLTFAPDGRTLALATASGTVTLFDVATGQALQRISVGSGEIRSLVFSRDGSFFATTFNDSILCWNAHSLLPFKEIKGFAAPVMSLDLSCDKTLMAAGCADGKIILVDLKDGAHSPLSGHLGEVGEVRLFSDAKWLVSAGKDKFLRLWDLSTRKEALKIASLDGEIASITLDFPGLTLFTGAENGVVRRWNIQWDYGTPSPKRLLDDSDNLLESLAASYALALFFQNQSGPEKYYSASAKKLPTRYRQTSLSARLVNMVYAEAQYRGLVNVSYEQVKEKLERLWKSKASFPRV